MKSGDQLAAFNEKQGVSQSSREIMREATLQTVNRIDLNKVSGLILTYLETTRSDRTSHLSSFIRGTYT